MSTRQIEADGEIVTIRSRRIDVDGQTYTVRYRQVTGRGYLATVLRHDGERRVVVGRGWYTVLGIEGMQADRKLKEAAEDACYEIQHERTDCSWGIDAG